MRQAHGLVSRSGHAARVKRCLLLLVGVLLLLAVQLDQDLTGLDAVAEVGEDAPHLAVGL